MSYSLIICNVDLKAKRLLTGGQMKWDNWDVRYENGVPPPPLCAHAGSAQIRPMTSLRPGRFIVIRRTPMSLIFEVMNPIVGSKTELMLITSFYFEVQRYVSGDQNSNCGDGFVRLLSSDKIIYPHLHCMIKETQAHQEWRKWLVWKDRVILLKNQLAQPSIRDL